MSRLLYIYIIVLSSIGVFAQTADITSGCAELTVQFSAPEAESYFWSFGDNTFSDLQNPEHSYIQPGDYIVQLFDNNGGNQIGADIRITVYPEVEFSITADTINGCSPLTVNFSASVNAHPDIDIEEIVWTFGDGGSAMGSDVTYTYMRPNIYDVSLKVITRNDIKCDEPKIFADFIEAQGANTGFSTDEDVICDVPAEFRITNTTFNDEGATYLWEFGDGETSTEKFVGRHSYNQAGSYQLRLTTTTPLGCVTSWGKELIVGSPIISIENDTICPLIENQLVNLTVADEFDWNFRLSDLVLSPDSERDDRSPIVIPQSTGNKLIILTATSDAGCETTDTINIHVEKPNSDFQYDQPINSCLPSFDFSMTAEDKNLAQYKWINSITGTNGTITDASTIQLSYEAIVRDPYYFNGPDSLSTLLAVTSRYGCVDTTEVLLPIDKPEAFFIPDVVKGCEPMVVEFEDLSFSPRNIINRSWDFGDGNSRSLGRNDTITNHTYHEAGIYIATLVITNEVGCIDTSRQVEIEVISKEQTDTLLIGIPTDGSPESGEGPMESPVLCVGDIVRFPTAQDPYSVKIETNEGRFGHCIIDTFIADRSYFPGKFPVDYLIEADGIFIDSIRGLDSIEILGSHSILDYNIDCQNPFTINLDASESINADIYRWYIDGNLVSEETEYSHTFNDRGDYVVSLETENSIDPCRAHLVEKRIAIRDVKANFEIADVLCDNISYTLDASPSVDVLDGCRAGIKWIFEYQAPKSVGSFEYQHQFVSGAQNLTLVASDINGCSDTLTKPINVYGIDEDINIDSTICINSEIQLIDLSQADTDLVNWEWQIGETTLNEQNPTYKFSMSDIDRNYQPDTISVKLILTDAVGCQDTVTRLLEPYIIDTEMLIDNGPRICVGDIINFEVTDYNDQGSYLNFEWDFQQYGTSDDNMETIVFTDSGDYNISVRYTENATGCTSTLDTLIEVFEAPIADFSSPFDDEDFICFPEQIPFTNNSIEDGPVIYQWSFSNGERSTLENPTVPFDKGEWFATLVVSSFYGCSDTLTKSYELVGPEGSFEIDKAVICPGEPVTFRLVDPQDVVSYTWDMGNGTQIDDTNPLTYTYEPLVGVTTFLPRLIIRSDNEGCEKTFELPLDLSFVNADFNDSLSFCQTELYLDKTFDGASSQSWIINGESVSTADNLVYDIPNGTTDIVVNLSVIDDRNCQVNQELLIELEELEETKSFMPNVFSPNNDNKNDFFNYVIEDKPDNVDITIDVFRIYNRWGQLLYDNYNPKAGWDGNYLGQPVPSDVYAYYIEYRINDCDITAQKGNITVIR